MKSANETSWNAVLEIYKNENDASEKAKLVNGLANIQDATILKR